MRKKHILYKIQKYITSLLILSLYSLHSHIKSIYCHILLYYINKGWAKKGDVFFGCLFRQTSNVDILETFCSNDLKFELRIVVDRVPLQIKF